MLTIIILSSLAIVVIGLVTAAVFAFSELNNVPVLIESVDSDDIQGDWGNFKK